MKLKLFSLDSSLNPKVGFNTNIIFGGSQYNLWRLHHKLLRRSQAFIAATVVVSTSLTYLGWTLGTIRYPSPFLSSPPPPIYRKIVFVQLGLKYCQNPTQLNSTQRNSKATSVGVRHSSHVFPTPPPHPTTTTNFSNTSRPARELQFGTDTQ